MAQPIKDIIEYKNYLSKEIKNIIDNAKTHIIESMSNYSEITIPLFLLEAYESEMSLIRTIIVPFLTGNELKQLNEALFNLVKEEEPTSIRVPKKDITVSTKLQNAIVESLNIKKELDKEYISSDHILLCILKNKQVHPKLYGILSHFGLTYDTLRNVSSIMQSNFFTDKKKQDEAEKIYQNFKQTAHNVKKEKKFYIDITNSSNSYDIEKVIGRERELNEIYRVLNRRKCNNVILIGKPGVGKTSIIEGIAYEIINKTCPKSLSECKILKLNLNEVISGTSLRGMLEERINTLVNQLNEDTKSILFIDNIHYMLSSKKKEDYDICDILITLLSNKNIKIISTITEDGYKTTIGNNKQIESKFQNIIINPPSPEESLIILKKIKEKYEKYHNVTYTDDAIELSVKLSERYITERVLPLSAIDIIDESGANVNVNRNDNNTIAINGDDIRKTISERTKIPLEKLSVNDKQIYTNLHKKIKESLIGQDEAVDTITNCIKRNKVGLSNKNKPIGTFMAIGNTGCGKTLMAKLIAKEVFGDEHSLVRFDMSEYNDKTSVNKLIGSSTGYIGYENGGLLTESVKLKKHCVILIDEIEKAADEVYNVFLQLLDEGFLTDNKGNKVDFKNTIIIMTSNVGAKKASMEKPFGFNQNMSLNKKNTIEKELKKKFPPEFINRLDEVLFFNELTDENLKKIISLELNKTCEKLNEIKCNLIYNTETVNYLLKSISNEKEYGARPIRKKIENEIENKITDLLLMSEQDNGLTFSITLENDIINIKIEN